MKSKSIIDKNGRPVVHAVTNAGWGFYPGYHSYINIFWYLPKSVVHTARARLAPLISHHLNLFHRRCWMALKVYVNFRFLRPA
jgi:hypothetical protein